MILHLIPKAMNVQRVGLEGMVTEYIAECSCNPLSKNPYFWQKAVKNLRLISEAMNVRRVGLAGMVTEHILAELFCVIIMNG